ncbi:MAG: uracil-DNA glycosylase [Caldimonas sp.]
MKAADLDAAFASLPPAWVAVLPGWTRDRLDAVRRRVEAVSGDRPIAPDDPFRALRLVAPDEVKVVVIGQDPYPTAGHADGLAFSAGTGRPRSLARVFAVLAADRPGSFEPPEVWKLDDWARRGVLLLNPVLTVEVDRSGSHMNCGWQALTLEIVHCLSNRPHPPVFLLWGAKARAFWTAAAPGEARALVTRHPSYDFAGDFMAEASHFEATADLVDWWAIGRRPSRVL